MRTWLEISRRRFIAASAATLTSALLPHGLRGSGVSPPNDWASHGFGPEQRRHNPAERDITPDSVSRLAVQWEFEAGSGITSTPAVVGDRVIVGSWDGRAYCLDRRSGRLRWSFATVPEESAGGGLIAPPSLDVATRTLYAATGNPFHATGRWCAPPDGRDHSSSLVALDATSGRLRWADQVHPHDERNLDLNCPPMLLSVTADRPRELVVVGGKDGLRAWDRTSRRRLWRVEVTPAPPAGGKEALPSTGPEAGPTAAAAKLGFFASHKPAHQTRLGP